jgi:hypothetical protein
LSEENPHWADHLVRKSNENALGIGFLTRTTLPVLQLMRVGEYGLPSREVEFQSTFGKNGELSMKKIGFLFGLVLMFTALNQPGCRADMDWDNQRQHVRRLA